MTGRKIGVLIVLGMTFLSCVDGRGGVENISVPFDSTSKRIVPVLRNHGYEVTFRLHPEGHVPGPRLDDARAWYARS